MTLAELLPAARRLSALEKLQLIRILAEDLETSKDIEPLEPFKTYSLPTPYDCFGGGSVLMQSFQQSDIAQQ